MKNLFATFLLIPLMAAYSCSESNFSGGAPAPVQKPKPEAPKDSNDLKQETTPQSVVVTEDLGKIEDCPKGTMVEDPNATFTFQNGEGKVFINSLANITPIPVAAWNTGSIHGDKASVDAVCRLKGYVASESFTTGRYHSCHDNTHGYWNDSIKNFEIKGACVNNVGAKIIVCKGLLKDPCAKDKSWIFQKDQAAPVVPATGR